MSNRAQINKTLFNVGDTVVVSHKIQEGDKTRTQPFEGIVIAIKGSGENKSFTVRKIAVRGIGVERIWPLNSPWISRIKVKKKAKAKRAKLYYLRQRVGKKATRVKASGTTTQGLGVPSLMFPGPDLPGSSARRSSMPINPDPRRRLRSRRSPNLDLSPVSVDTQAICPRMAVLCRDSSVGRARD